MRIGLVVRSFNEERHIGRLLAGTLRQDVVPHTIVLVDSGSTDATISIAAQFEHVRVVTITPDEFSFGRALNLGIEAASDTDVVVFASAHVYPLRTSWIGQLVSPFADPEVVISYGKQIGDERTRFSEQQLFEKWFPDTSSGAQTHPFCNNANAAIRTSWWRDNPYDETLTGLEDVAAGQRALAQAKRVAYVAEAAVAHVHDEDFSRLLNRYRREAIALKRVYPHSHMSAPEAALLFVTNSGLDAYAAAKQRKLGALPDVVRFRFAQFLGGYLGHRSSAVPPALRRRLYYPRRFWRPVPEPDRPGELIDYRADVYEDEK